MADRWCGWQPDIGAAGQDRLLQVAEVLRRTLEALPADAVLVARSGLDLQRFGLRYSHAGIALRRGAGSPWAVRQLYYDCDDQRPRVFDQGLAGFAAGTLRPSSGHFSVAWLPREADATLARTAQDRALALALVAGRYSANAHAWSTRYQNCNQWLLELMAAGFGGLVPDGAGADPLRERAQGWLRDAGYRPAAIDAGSHWVMFAAGFVPWLHLDDRPEADRHTLRFEVTVPSAIERFVRERWPGGGALELCHAGDRVVVRRGGAPLDDGCTPAPGDEVHALR